MMEILYVGGFAAAGLLVYLIRALLKAEEM